MWHLPLFPDQASTTAQQVDYLFFGVLAVAVFFTVLIFFAVFFFALRYRRGTKANRKGWASDNVKLEVAWTVIPFLISMGIFVWAARVYFDMHVAPKNAMEIYVVGKQWMWYIEHPQGHREINELHVPVGTPVKLIMTSQDVIHSFYIPAFRIKQDVLPGRFSTEWFKATKTGEFHLFCAEFCGTGHSAMVGKVVVMEPEDYERWLSGALPGQTMATSGDQLFNQFGCVTCHKADNTGRGPSLKGVFGSTVTLNNGQKVLADQDYIRESILDPPAKVVKGYQPIMPNFRQQLTQEQVIQLIEYVKSQGGKKVAAGGK